VLLKYLRLQVLVTFHQHLLHRVMMVVLTTEENLAVAAALVQ
jgi:hypothetical protein